MRDSASRGNPLARAFVALLIVAASSSVASGAKKASDPLSIAADAEREAGSRAKAVRESYEQMKKGELERSVWREAIKTIAWKASVPAKVRLPAMEALLEDDEADSRRAFLLMLPREPQRPVVDLICGLAAERGWKEATPAIVRSWSRRMIEPPDEERSERAALLALHPARPVEDVVFEVFVTPASGSGPEWLAQKARGDAWALLCRIDKDRAKTKALLAGSAPAEDDPTLSALRVGASDLGVVPATAEQLDWLMTLRTPEHEAFWRDGGAAVASLRQDQREGFELRHLAGVLRATRSEPSLLSKSRDELLADATAALKARKKHQRIAEAIEGKSPDREALDFYAERLVWGDLLLITFAAGIPADDSLARALFEQVDADRKDTTTEHGGVMDGAGDGSLACRPFPPRAAQRPGDNRFVASPEMIEGGAASLFHYHFHARTANEAEFAGPSAPDLEYADVFGRSCLVFTSISKDVLGVDYYQPDGAVIDLGEVRRPGK